MLTELQPFEFSHFRQLLQLLLQFSMDLFETLLTCCGHIEDVHVGF